MMLKIDHVLTRDEAINLRRRLDGSEWVDGRTTAGAQSALAKHNLQIPEGSDIAREAGDVVLKALRDNAAFVSAALPLRVFPPLFNRYDEGMRFDAHIDNAIRFSDTARIRTDISATLFLTDPEDYDGGELIVADTFGEHAVKLAAGSMVIYPASSLHRVATVTRGSRWASFFWLQSMVRSAEQRSLLYRVDRSIQAISAKLGVGDETVLRLTGDYHNLVRMWSDS